MRYIQYLLVYCEYIASKRWMGYEELEEIDQNPRK